MRSLTATLVLSLLLSSGAFGQQPDAAQNPDASKNRDKKAKAEKVAQAPEGKPAETTPPAPPAHAEPPKEAAGEHDKGNEERYDVTEVAPIVTHHQITVDGKLLRYTATAGRLPIKRGDGKIEAEMFFVSYTLDGQEAGKRPLTFSFNGGPGSASVWLHMGAVGPKRVVLQPNGFMPAAPYHLTDNQNTLLDKSDIVMVDAMNTGFSRAADAEATKKFLGVKGDIEAFGEFIRLYLTRYERWSSPLFLLGESYGTTRAAGIAGYLAGHGISFNGITLLSMAMDFATLEWKKNNDAPYVMLLPTFSMIAAYHKKLPADVSQDPAKMRQEVEQWASNDYALALAKGDAISPDEKQKVVAQLARYTGLPAQLIDQHDMRIDVPTFTHYLLIDQKVRVGRLDGRFTGPEPGGERDENFDPTGSAILPPYTSVFNNYVRTELGYKTDMPYRVFAYDEPGFRNWDWGSGIEGFPNTATGLRAAIVQNPYLKILVMEGYYDLATPYFAANYSMDHLNLGAAFRKNISYATYESGHMVYVDSGMHAKMKKDLVNFMDLSLAGAQ
jgi:carboxypeptidase C (cathepsin A)